MPLSIFYISLEDQLNDGDYSDDTLAMTLIILSIIGMLALGVAQVTMLIMLQKFSAPLTQAEESSIMMRFLSRFNND